MWTSVVEDACEKCVCVCVCVWGGGGGGGGGGERGGLKCTATSGNHKYGKYSNKTANWEWLNRLMNLVAIAMATAD